MPDKRPTPPDRRRSSPGRRSALERFLTGTSKPEDALGYHEAQGFLFAVAASPEAIAPSDWLPIVLGREVPATGRSAGRVLDDLFRLHNRLLRDIRGERVGLPEDCPFLDDLLANFAADAPIRQWSRGFLLGHHWLEACWDVPLPDEADQELGAVTVTLGFFSSREFAEELLKTSSDGRATLAGVAELSRRTFREAMASYAMLGQILAQALATAPASQPERVGRNEPCPCGSGKKFKRCCAPKSVDLLERAAVRIRRAQAGVEPKVARFVGSVVDPETDRRLRAGFACGYDEVMIRGTEETLFEPWVLYDWIREPESDRRSMAAQYLERHGARVDADERRFLEATCATPCGFHEVLEVERGRRLRLRDLLLETEHEVYERSASQTLRAGDLIYGRVVPFDGVALLIGMGEIPLPPRDKPAVIRIRTRLRKESGPPSAAIVRMVEDRLRELYFGLRRRLVDPRPPELVNTDGETIELHTITCEVDSLEDACAALASLATGHSRDELLEQAERDADGRPTRVEIPWLARKKQRDGMRVSLGRIVLEGTRLEAEVNSAGRSRRLQRSLRKRLGSSMRGLTVAIQPLDEAMADYERVRDSPEARRLDEESAALEEDPEVREALRDYRDRRWAAWVDEELPALDGQTPREAVRDADGREKVEALLDDFERTEGDRPGDGYDFDRIRRALGLEVR